MHRAFPSNYSLSLFLHFFSSYSSFYRLDFLEIKWVHIVACRSRSFRSFGRAPPFTFPNTFLLGRDSTQLLILIYVFFFSLYLQSRRWRFDCNAIRSNLGKSSIGAKQFLKLNQCKHIKVRTNRSTCPSVYHFYLYFWFSFSLSLCQWRFQFWITDRKELAQHHYKNQLFRAMSSTYV